MTLIKPDNQCFSYMGRIDDADKAAPVFYYPGSMALIRATGKSFAVKINSSECTVSQLGYVIDGVAAKVNIPAENCECEIKLCDNLDDTLHEVIIYKSHDATHYFTFLGLVAESGSTTEKYVLPSRKIECFGDSVSAGAVCEALDCTGKLDPPDHNGRFDNSWYSFTMQAARLLNAQIHNNAQGGIALLDGTGYFCGGEPGLASMLDRLAYAPYWTITQWDYSRYTPDVVVIAIGQNDSHRENAPDNDICDPSYRKMWKDNYISVLKRLRTHYENAVFVLCTTVLMHDSQWDCAIDEAMAEFADPKVHRLYFSRNGKATPGHPRIPEDAEMARELAGFIASLKPFADAD